MSEQAHPVIYFDGQCNLCNGFVSYVIKRDPEGIFRFASLQSDAAAHIDAPHLSDGSFESMVLEQSGTIYRYSDAALNIFSQLQGPSRMMRIFKIVPRVIRDAMYRWVARNRYGMFGKTDQCMIPTPDILDRFVSKIES